jgi:small neutral amino acid transporter SnatA (MarC family)
MVLVGQATHDGYRLGLAAAIVGSLFVTFLFLLAGPLITDRIGPTGQKVTNKIMGLIEAVIGIQFVINGVTAVAVQIMREAGKSAP